jgi:hypothetical protein
VGFTPLVMMSTRASVLVAHVGLLRACQACWQSGLTELWSRGAECDGVHKISPGR